MTAVARPAQPGAAGPGRGPLVGRGIGITADRRWEEQAKLFTARGATVIHGPALATVDLTADRALRQVTERLIGRPPQWLVVTTAVGLRLWLGAARQWGLDGALREGLAGAQVAARGAKAASEARRSGLAPTPLGPPQAGAGGQRRRLAAGPPPPRPERKHERERDSRRSRPGWGTETMQGLIAQLVEQDLSGAVVAVQLYDRTAPSELGLLRAAGAEVVEVPVYQWARPEDAGPALVLVEAAIKGELDAVTFTSQPAVHQLFDLAREAGRADQLRMALNQAVTVGCVGPVCARAAQEEGVRAPVWPDPPRLPALVALVTEHLVTERLAGAPRAGATSPRAGAAQPRAGARAPGER